MSSSRRAARGVAAPVKEMDPNGVYTESLLTPRGKVRAWFKGGVCQKVRVSGIAYSWGEGTDVWEAVQDGSFRPIDFGKHNE